MNSDSVLAAGRAAAESRMSDSCVIRRSTGATFDDETGTYTQESGEVYAGPCRVQEGTRTQAESEAGGRELVHLEQRLDLPIGVVDVAVDDVAEITASLDPALVGRKLRISQLMFGTHKTARRLPVEDVTA